MSERAVYLRAIEAHFVALRGQGMMLSATDVARVEKWHADDVPLNVVKRVLQDGMAAYAHEHPHERPPRSLSFFEKAVRKSMRERAARLIDSRATAGRVEAPASSTQPVAAGPRAGMLDALDAHLEAAAAGEARAALGAARERLAEAPADADVWALTADVDAAMVEALADGLKPTIRAGLSADAQAAVDAVGDGGAVMSERARSDRFSVEFASRVREHFGVPDLMEVLLARRL